MNKYRVWDSIISDRGEVFVWEVEVMASDKEDAWEEYNSLRSRGLVKMSPADGLPDGEYGVEFLEGVEDPSDDSW